MPITEPGQERTRFIQHRGEQILLLDYSDIYETEEALIEIHKTKRLIAQQQPGSVRTLTYVRGSRYNPEIVEAMKDLAAHNKPYVSAAAVVGLATLHRIIYRTVTTFSRRTINVFNSLDDAKDWLVEQL